MKIVSFDFDLTITLGITGIEYVGDKISKGDPIREAIRLFLDARIDNNGFTDITAGLFRGERRADICDVARGIPIIKNLKEAIVLLQQEGYYCMINTLTYDFIVDPFMTICGIPFCTGVQMNCDENGVLTGEIARYCSAQDKVSSVLALAKDRQEPLEQLIAIGDSAGDIPIFRQSNFGIAINSSSRDLLDIADAHIVTDDALSIVREIIKLNKNIRYYA